MAPTSQRGFSLTELLLVFVVVLSAAGVVLAGVTRALETSREQQSVAFVRQMMLDLQALRPDRNYAGLTAAELIRAGKIPAELQRSGGTVIQGPWGGVVTLSAWEGWYSNTTIPNGYWVHPQGLDMATCQALVRGTYRGTYGVRDGIAFAVWPYLAERGDNGPQQGFTDATCSRSQNNALLIYVHAGRL